MLNYDVANLIYAVLIYVREGDDGKDSRVYIYLQAFMSFGEPRMLLQAVLIKEKKR